MAWLAVESTVYEYAWIRRNNEASSGSASGEVASNEGQNIANRADNVEELASRFAR